MFGYLILLFTLLPAIELMILIKMGTHIGVGNTFFVIIFTGVLGAYLARYQGFMALNKVQTQLNKGHLPNEELMDGMMILVGGVVLLTPGIITDVFGFILLIPLTRSLLKKILKSKFENMLKNGQVVNMTPFPKQHKKYDDIDI